MRAIRGNLKQRAAPPLAQWLIHAARRRSSVTYGEAARRLEIEFDKVFPTRMGIPAGALMHRILEVQLDCPLQKPPAQSTDRSRPSIPASAPYSRSIAPTASPLGKHRVDTTRPGSG